MKSMKGQVAIFVIVAIVIIGGVVGYFAVFKPEVFSLDDQINPKLEIRKCIEESVGSKIEKMIPQGGFVNPQDYKIYNDIKVSYLCKNINNYEPCVSQHPLYLSDLSDEIEESIREEVEECYVSTGEGLIERNYDVKSGILEKIEVILKPDKVEVNVERDFSFEKKEVSGRIDSVEILINSGLYGLANVAQVLASQEAKYCYFEYVGYSNLYPRYKISKWTMSDSTRIYTILDDDTGEEMNVAIRGCAVPAGY